MLTEDPIIRMNPPSSDTTQVAGRSASDTVRVSASQGVERSSSQGREESRTAGAPQGRLNLKEYKALLPTLVFGGGESVRQQLRIFFNLSGDIKLSEKQSLRLGVFSFNRFGGADDTPYVARNAARLGLPGVTPRVEVFYEVRTNKDGVLRSAPGVRLFVMDWLKGAGFLDTTLGQGRWSVSALFQKAFKVGSLPMGFKFAGDHNRSLEDKPSTTYLDANLLVGKKTVGKLTVEPAIGIQHLVLPSLPDGKATTPNISIRIR